MHGGGGRAPWRKRCPFIAPPLLTFARCFACCAASCLNPKVRFHRCTDAPFSDSPIHLPPPTAADREAKANGGGGGGQLSQTKTDSLARLACQRGGEEYFLNGRRLRGAVIGGGYKVGLGCSATAASPKKVAALRGRWEPARLDQHQLWTASRGPR